MKISRILTSAAAVLLVGSLAVPSDGSPATAGPGKQAFETFRGLAGSWHATTADGDRVELDFEVVAEGTAVLERLRFIGDGGEHDMVTLYHLDGDEILLTHYCSANNQPRMRSATASGDGKEIRFELVDVANLSSPDAGHMHRAVFEFQSENRFKSAWTWRQKGSDAFTVELDARRARP